MLAAAVMLWTLWVTDPATGAPLAPMGRFTTDGACILASYRIGLVVGITTTCLPYTLLPTEKD
jgi:hypothetical protein